ncbi:MAG: PAS domain S-box protein [Nitrospirae bacterium]|nr:PAS domain S-box protein [Candidatus Manganitrophaceae bacterium]
MARPLNDPRQERAMQNEALSRVQAALEASRNRYSDLYNFAPVGYFTLDHEGLILEANLKGLELLGIKRGLLDRKPFSVFIPKKDQSRFHAHRRSVFKDKTRQVCEIRLRKKDGIPFDAQLESIRVEDPSRGEVCRTVISDITDRKQAEAERAQLLMRAQRARADAEQAQLRLAFLAEASTLLSNSLDYELTLGRVARLAVPYLADGCIVDVIKEDGLIRRVAVAALHCNREAAGWELMQCYPPETGRAHPLQQVLRSGKSIFLPEISDSLLQSIAGDPGPPEIARCFWPKSAMLVPLLARGRTLGVISFLSVDSGRRYVDADLVLAEDLTLRAALAVDNARLYRAAKEEIAERKRAEEAIRTMNEALREKNLRIEEASQARSRFFSYMSHELKTPVNSIVGFTQLLRNNTYGALAPNQATAVARIHSNARDLMHLINNILDLAKLESGKMALQVMEVNLKELAEKVLLNFEPQLREKGLQIEKRMEGEHLACFMTDPMQVRSILTNLLSNAVKFTDRGGIRLVLSGREEGGAVRFEISDTGVGIDPAHLERIFEEYERRGGVGKDTGGTGLGLAIVRRMVHFLGGQIEVASALNVGTTFTLSLPEHRPAAPLLPSAIS